jgi:hypothetical protein
MTPQLIQLNWLFVFKDHILVWHTLVDDLARTHQSQRNLNHFALLKLTREIYPHFWMHAMQMHILYLTPFYSQNPGMLHCLSECARLGISSVGHPRGGARIGTRARGRNRRLNPNDQPLSEWVATVHDNLAKVFGTDSRLETPTSEPTNPHFYCMKKHPFAKTKLHHGARVISPRGQQEVSRENLPKTKRLSSPSPSAPWKIAKFTNFSPLWRSYLEE